jgi:formamidopyrimidine-DNA glycosylase
VPELPEVETIRRGLNQKTLGQTIQGGQVLRERTLAYPPSTAEFWQNLRGTTIAEWHRRGKYLLAQLSSLGAESSGWLGVHLRMTGQLFWLKQEEPLQKHTRLRFFFAEGWELRFVDTRTFGKIWWVPPTLPPKAIIKGLKNLGAEPLSADFSLDYLAHRIQNRHRPIKSLLLDQEFIAGIGNIYADEALFCSGIRPETIASRLSCQQLECLRLAVIKVLETAILQGGTTFSDYRDVTGINGNYGGIAWVYGRYQEPCRTCNTPIERIRLGGRSTHFCPQCQK